MATTRIFDDVDLVALLERLRSAPVAPEAGPADGRRLRWVAQSLPAASSVSAVSDPPGTWPAHLARVETARLVAEGTSVWARADALPDGSTPVVAPHVLGPDDATAGVDPAHVALVAAAARASEVPPQRLYVVQRGGGATRTLRKELLSHLQDKQRSLVLEHVDGDLVVVRAAVEDRLEPVARWQPGGAPYDAFVARLLIGHAVESVHLLHPDEHVSEVAGLLGVPVVTPGAADPESHPLTAANLAHGRYLEAERAAELPTLAIVTPGEPDRIAPTAHVRALRRAIAAAGRGALRWERMVAADYIAGRTGAPPAAILLVRNALRPGEPEGLLERARADGTRVLLDLDDDLVTDHAVRRLTAQGWDAEQLTTLRRLLPEVDTVTVSTPPLAELVATDVARVVCRPNELDPRLWSRVVDTAPAPDDDTVRVLYMGSRTHDEDLALLDGVVEQVATRLGREVVLEIVGVASGEAEAPGMRRLTPTRTDYPGFVTWLREQAPRWSVGVAPLVDTRFNRCKSDLKLLEYALLGLPSVASDVGPYAGSELTRLTANSTDAWVAALVAAIEAGPAVAERAAARVRAHRMLDDHNVEAWVETVLGQPR